MKTGSIITDNDKLRIISGEPNIQKRLALLAKHGFKAEASKLIRSLARMHTAMFYFDWHERDFCEPLERVTPFVPGVYVIISSGSKLDYDPPHNLVIFELGWERVILDWSEEESVEFVRQILSQALTRPINQWSFKQSEGTGQAARRSLPPHDPTAREIAALHLVYHLRQADFNNMSSYLRGIEGFAFGPDCSNKQPSPGELVNWVADRLLALGWDIPRVRKELVEWISLKKEVWGNWMLAVVNASIFGTSDLPRAVALRRWIMQRFDHLIGICYNRDTNAEAHIAEVYKQLFQIAQLGNEDSVWIIEKLVKLMALGNSSSVHWFCREFPELAKVGSIYSIRSRAAALASHAGDYGITLALLRQAEQEIQVSQDIPDELVAIVELRELSTELT